MSRGGGWDTGKAAVSMIVGRPPETEYTGPNRDLLIETIWRAIRDYDRAKRTARDLRAANRGNGPIIKRGTGRAALCQLIADRILAEPEL